jgi:pimeloyl-ACP methyl ester carboxylesterase
MTAILVHGVPDTEHVWRAVVSRLGRRDVVTVRLPGFGCSAPSDFPATKDAYATWLVEQMAAHAGPVDLVGHDWGALLVLRAACLRPAHVRTWVAGAAPLDAEYTWHKAAQLWQTPEVGEKVMAQLTATVLDHALAAAGVPPDDARAAAARLDDTMKRCILALYRSAARVGEEWGPDLARLSARGMVLWGDRDPYAAPTWGERLARRTGARFVSFTECSHWWPLERPQEVAAMLTEHWQDGGR